MQPTRTKVIMKIQRPIASNCDGHPGYLMYDENREYECIIPYISEEYEKDLFSRHELKVYHEVEVIDFGNHFITTILDRVGDQSW